MSVQCMFVVVGGKQRLWLCQYEYLRMSLVVSGHCVCVPACLCTWESYGCGGVSGSV